MRRALRIAVAVLLLAAAGTARPAHAEGRTVKGTIVRLDRAARTFTVRDAAGVFWSYRVDPDAGVDLGGFHVGDRVTVTIGRPTPLNMTTPADRVRKGDHVGKDTY